MVARAHLCLCVLIVQTILIRVSLAASCRAKCGIGREVPNSTIPANFEEPTKQADSISRIVNGWDAPPRPWMVLIRSINPSDPEDYDTCGGAIVNDRYVLTAGHCVCIAESRIAPCTDGKLGYSPASIMKLYVGLNEKNVQEVMKRYRALHEFDVAEAKPHPDWTGTGLSPPDLAIIKSAKPFQLNGEVAPLCLPPLPASFSRGSPSTPSSPLWGKNGYVAGWGLTKNEDCFTDNYGPSRHSKCRFPFKYQGHTISECFTAETPTTGNKRCQEFRTAMGNSLMPKKGEAIIIRFGTKGHKTLCYTPHAGKYGWCGVCLHSTNPEKYGYCPEGIAPSDEDKIMTVPKPSKDWGFCSKLCTKQEMRPNQMQETRLNILDDSACSILNSSQLIFRNNLEFCAGFKMPYPEIPVYKRFKLMQPVNGSIYTYRLVKKTRNYLGAKEKHKELDYYIGQTDSCQGDSGGPLYVFAEGRAYVVGVVSRGGQCAGFNQPGIYTNLLYPKWREWLEKETSSGGC